MELTVIYKIWPFKIKYLKKLILEFKNNKLIYLVMNNMFMLHNFCF